MEIRLVDLWLRTQKICDVKNRKIQIIDRVFVRKIHIIDRVFVRKIQIIDRVFVRKIQIIDKVFDMGTNDSIQGIGNHFAVEI
jgi:hypothetical protein